MYTFILHFLYEFSLFLVCWMKSPTKTSSNIVKLANFNVILFFYFYVHNTELNTNSLDIKTYLYLYHYFYKNVNDEWILLLSMQAVVLVGAALL